MDLIAKFQNLERFATAQKLVSKDLVATQKAIDGFTNRVEVLTEEIAHLEGELGSLEAVRDTSAEESAVNLRKSLQALVAEHASLAALKQFYDDKQQEIDDIESDYSVAVTKLTDISGEVASLRSTIKLGEALVAEGKCSRCGQPSSDVGAKTAGTAKKQLELAVVKKTAKEQEVANLQKRMSKARDEISDYELKLEKVEIAIAAERRLLAQAEKSATKESKRNAVAAKRCAELGKSLRHAKVSLKACNRAMASANVDQEMLLYAKQAFSREGMPLYLSAGLCPVLNNAADEYSELLTDGKLKVQFAVEDGEFAASIVNPAGSETTDGQSVGEAATAGLITALAVREGAPRSNLLILDEPGHGLDPEGARLFAQSLLKLKGKIPTILVTTHSPAMESVLSGEQVWTVEKQDGISRLIQ